MQNAVSVNVPSGWSDPALELLNKFLQSCTWRVWSHALVWSLAADSTDQLLQTRGFYDLMSIWLVVWVPLLFTEIQYKLVKFTEERKMRAGLFKVCPLSSNCQRSFEMLDRDCFLFCGTLYAFCSLSSSCSLKLTLLWPLATDCGKFKHNFISVPFSAFLNARVRPVKFKESSPRQVYKVIF